MLVSETVKQHWIVVFTKVIETTSLIQPLEIMQCVFGEWEDFLGWLPLQCAEFG
jgi:hypothetical protein